MLASQVYHRSEKPWFFSEGLSLTSVCTSPLLSRELRTNASPVFLREHLEQQVFRSPLGRLGILPLSQADRERQSPGLLCFRSGGSDGSKECVRKPPPFEYLEASDITRLRA
ncbi:hypothetical protein EAG_07138 [Camponotus floridanus]|uniref:Uncharacterized protein n=1 Tax=Camponotus floridanus TaxID=104421 RepID=E2ADC2_CAMFO|nr:hypothetical protein EAG_07138 [Camponotus floridanus]